MPDFPRRRQPAPAWTRPITERLTPTVKALVIAITLGYVFFVLAKSWNEWMVAHLLLGPGLFRGELWQLVTSLWLNTRFVAWLFTVIGLWWVGAFVERARGTRFFIRLLLVSGLASNLAAALMTWVFAGAVGPYRSDGASFALLAVFVAFARIYGARPAQLWGALSMRADYFTWILVGFSLLVSLANGDWPGVVASVVAIGVALAFTGGVRDLRDSWRQARMRSRYRVLEGGKRKPTYFN